MTSDGHERLRWHFQSNRHADLTPRFHSSEWPRDDQGNRRFLRLAIHGIQANDTIQIIPKAHFMAWRNHVVSASITVKGRRKNFTMQQKAATLPADIYDNLDQDEEEIRVLEVLPGPPDSPLVCKLVKTRLVHDRHKPYEALSYVWGDDHHKQTIHLDGRPFDITVNLHAALKRLRHENSEVRTIWADAICINQVDLVERGSQVKMMGLIYAKALRVVVWLGQLALHVHDIRRLRGGIASVIQDQEEMPLPPETTYYEDVTSEHFNALALDDNNEASQLLELPWFRRVWVLQEVFNAHEIIAHCGTHILPWSTVLQINMAVNRRLTMPGPSYARVMPAVYSQLFTLTTATDSVSPNFSYRVTSRPEPERLLDFLIAGLDLDATDQRDKLFALLNIFPAFTDDAALQPDYTKNVSAVFRDFTRWWIITYKSLRILSAVHCAIGRTWQKLSTLPVPPDRQEHPTWALPWFGKSAWGRASLALFPENKHNASDEQGPAAGSQQTAYHASRKRVPNTELLKSNSNPKILLLKGIRIGIVDRIEPFPFYGQGQHLDLFRPAYERLFDPINQRAIFVAGSEAPTHTKNRPHLTEDHKRAHASYLLETGGAIECHTPCFFAIQNGQRGLCPSTARVGDTVVVLFGGDVPYLLRPAAQQDAASEEEQAFTFVGECFLRGHMKGQALDKPDLKSEVFALL